MNFAFFESLSRAQALEFLNAFLISERKAVSEMIGAAEAEGIPADFTILSATRVLEWAISKLNTLPREPDETLPSWIRQSDSYTRNLFDFDEPSKILILRCAYYLGESFVNHSALLSWNIGNRDTAVQNMPVVTGFRFNLELAPMLVAENLFGAIIADGAARNETERTINAWLGKLPD